MVAAWIIWPILSVGGVLALSLSKPKKKAKIVKFRNYGKSY
jgi:hypothetical protein